MNLGARARDFFLLRQAAEEAGRRPAERRAAVGASLALGRQRAEAGEALWSNGHAAEGLRLAVDALASTLLAASALRPEVDAEGEVGWRDVLTARGASADRVDALARTLALAEQPLPELDASVSTTHAELYKELFRARAAVDAWLSPACLTTGQVRWKVAQRWSTVALSVGLVAIALFFMLRTPRTVSVTANGFFRSDPQFGPDKATDDDPNTEWLLNDGQTGWLEARLSPPRDLTQVRVLNGHNRHFNDRAIKEVQVELFDASGQKVFENDAEMAFSPTPSWLEIPVSATNVERIRLNVRSHHRVGAALAELSFEER